MEKTFSGIVSQDGTLKLYDSAVFKAFLGTIRNERVLITISKEDPVSSKFAQNYFVKVVCASFVEIFRTQYGEHVSEEVASERLRSWCPITRRKDGLVPVEELSQEDINYLIKHSKMIASEQFDFYIHD